MILQELKARHDKLKKLDGGGLFKSGAYKIFGSNAHRYIFNPCLPENTLHSFESQFSCTLPNEYKQFLIQIGNGGSGPGYGLFALLDWNFELEINDENFLSTDFPHVDKWNITQNVDTDSNEYTETEEFQKWEEEYFSNSHITGSMRISHYGCAIYYLLIVTGKESGNIWVDDRANDYGVYPAVSKSTGKRLTFLDWYAEWLTESLNQFS